MDTPPHQPDQTPPDQPGQGETGKPFENTQDKPYIDSAVASPTEGFSRPASPAGETGSVPSGNGEEENPFFAASPPAAPPQSVAIKKILAVIILIAALLAVAFLVFSIIQRIFKKAEKITLVYWGLWEEEAVMRPIIASYQKDHPTITINYIKEDPKQYRERLQASIPKGAGPDIFRYHNTWVPMLKTELAAAPKNKLTPASFAETFYPVAKDDLVVGDIIYGVPLEIDGLSLVYNNDLFKAAGVSAPKTWEELRDVAVKLTVRDETGKIITGGVALGTVGNVEHFSDILAMMMLQNGADLKNPTSKEAQDALAFYRLFAEPPNNVWDNSLDSSILAFANGKVGMIFAPSWELATIKTINPAANFSTIPTPQLPGANIAWATYWVEGVSSKSKHIEVAWDFLIFLSSKETLTQLFNEESKQRGFGEPYSRVDLASTLTSDPLLGAYIQQAPLMRSFYLSSRTYDNGINDRMIKYLEDALNNTQKGVAPAAAVQTMAVGFSQVLSDFGFGTRTITSPAPEK